MDFNTGSDPLLQIAFWVGIAVYAATAILVFVMVGLRWMVDQRRQRDQATRQRWQQVFFGAIDGVAQTVDAPSPRERDVVMLSWIHCIEALRGEAHERLRLLGLQLQFEGAALAMLKRKGMRPRLLAVVALGRLQSQAAWPFLTPLVADANPMLSLLAARSLLQIDAERAIHQVLGALCSRDDWPLAKTTAMLREAPESAIAPPLLAALAQARADNAERLLAFCAPIEGHWKHLQSLLQPQSHPTVLCAALRACRDPRLLDSVRALQPHPDWAVRAQLASALGRIGELQDRETLQTMLADPQWWVRYRAAKALVQMPGLVREQLTGLTERLQDRFAADILRQALAEEA